MTLAHASAGSSIALPSLRDGALSFITGCGRSGTTILGQLIERHPSVAYLNDRFDLWLKPFASADIWSYRERFGAPESSEGRIALDASDAQRAGDAAREEFFALLEAERSGRERVVEKLAINNFRLGFLRALAPRACLINIVRHGVEVAHSIAQRAAQGRWYGQNDRKWTLMQEHARRVGLGDLLDRCESDFDRGLLEWRMSVDAAEPELERWPKGRLLRVRYEQLLADPEGVCDLATDALGLPRSSEMRDFARREVARRSPPARERPPSANTRAIAGEALARLGYECEAP